MAASKQKSLSIKDKVRILKSVEASAGQHGSKGRIAREFGIANSTLSTIIKDKQKILAAFDQATFEPERKRMRTATYEDVEDAVLLWFKNIRGRNVPVSGSILQTKAEELAKELGHHDFRCSNGWLQRFKSRHGIAQKRICGESSSVSEVTVDQWLSSLPTLIEGYEPHNIFNADETGLFFKLLPDKTLGFKKEPCHGGKHSKERITVLVGANVDGSEKLPLFVIGKSKKPRCFKNVRSLPVQYDASRKAWMTSSIFETWIRNLDRQFSRQKRSVLMILDNCPAHPIIEGLTNTKLAFLPPNTTSKLQPMDQGIIQALKAWYRKKLLAKLILSLDSGEEFSVNMLDALHFISAAWNEVTPTTLRNCFRKAGFNVFEESGDVDDTDSASLVSEVEQQLRCLQQSGMAGLDEITPEEYINADEEVTTAGELTNDEIVAQVQGHNSIEDDDDDDADTHRKKCPITRTCSNSVILKDTEVIRRYVNTEENVHRRFPYED